MGVKLGQVIWRKLIPDEIENADEILINGISYELLKSEQYKLAIKISEFGCNILKKHTNEESRRIILINSAIAYKAMGKKRDAIKLIDNQDWSGWSAEFQMALLILKDNFKSAIELMQQVGLSNKRLTEEAYLDWPLFKKFRETEEFKNVYSTLFKSPSIEFNNEIEKI